MHITEPLAGFPSNVCGLVDVLFRYWVVGIYDLCLNISIPIPAIAQLFHFHRGARTTVGRRGGN